MNRPPFRGRPGVRGPAQLPPGRPGVPGRAGGYQRPAPAKFNPLPIVLGATGVLLVVLVFLIMTGDAPKPAPVEDAAPPPKTAPPPKPVDVSGLEREGRKLCEEGLAIIKSLEPKIAVEASTLSDKDQQALKAELKKGLDLLKKGLEHFGEANEKSGRTYDLNKYIQAKKLASNKYLGLKGD